MVKERGDRNPLLHREKSQKLIIPPTPNWYLAFPPLSLATSLPTPTPAFVSSSHTRASTLHAQDVAAYSPSTSNTDALFLNRVLTDGTLSDRLSALTLLIQASPVHNIRALDALRALMAKKGREVSLKALRCLVDWWVGSGAPDRKLRYFRDQPVTHPNITNGHLVLWYFEDWLKKYFFGVLQILESLAVDPLPYVRTQATNFIFQLLKSKPEQEHNLLKLLIHKLGDAEKAVSSKASHFLLQLLETHPQMKGIIVNHVSELIFKSPTQPQDAENTATANSHARYYAIITFNQIVLSPEDKDVAEELVNVYFSLFKEILGEGKEGEGGQDEGEKIDFMPKKRGGKPRKMIQKRNGKAKGVELGFQEVPDSNAKLVSQILTGINRALPFAKSENSAEFDAHVDTLFRITHTATFNVSLQALMLLQRVALLRQSVVDRFYRALYASLVDARLATSSKQAMYLNLLFRAVKADVSKVRAAAFAKRLVQVLGMQQPAFVCGGLFLLGELFATAEMRELTSVGRKEVKEGSEEAYDARKRDPLFARAMASCLWELVPLQGHYHPSVALHACQLVNHEKVTATPDLKLNTLGHFLDRFVYKNPKKARPRGDSAMQPAAQLRGNGGKMGEAMNEETFWRREEGDVPVDQIFFHKYFKRKHEKDTERKGKMERRKGKGREKWEGGAEEGEEDQVEDEMGSGSDPEEAEIWNAMKASVPELGGSENGELSINEEEEEGNAEFDSLEDGSDGGMSDFVEDPDDLLSDAGDPSGLLEYGSGSEGSESEWDGFGDTRTSKLKRGRADGDQGAVKKRKTRRGEQPTFVSYEEYAEMIEREPEDNV